MANGVRNSFAGGGDLWRVYKWSSCSTTNTGPGRVEEKVVLDMVAVLGK